MYSFYAVSTERVQLFHPKLDDSVRRAARRHILAVRIKTHGDGRWPQNMVTGKLAKLQRSDGRFMGQGGMRNFYDAYAGLKQYAASLLPSRSRA